MLFYVLILLSPISIEILFRMLLPIHWCIVHYLSDNNLHQETILLHFLYLVINLLLNVSLLTVIYNSYKYPSVKIHETQLKISRRVFVFIFIFSGLIIILNIDYIPIIKEGGSNAAMFLSEYNKVRMWAFMNIIHILLIMMMFIFIKIIKEEKKLLKLCQMIYILLLAIINGKKGSLLSFLSNYSLIYLLYYAKEIKNITSLNLGLFKINKKAFKTFLLLIFLSFLGLAFIILQYMRTESIELYGYLLGTFQLLVNIIYVSSTVYLVQIIIDGGMSYAEEYSEGLGTFGFLKYFLNPFSKFFFGEGIESAIGPFLSSRLYGYELPFGVNPTLFFEYTFITGDVYSGFIFSTVNLFLIYILQILIIRKIIVLVRKESLLNTLYASLLFFLFNLSLFFKYDTLNAIRNLPFPIIALFLLLIIRSTRKTYVFTYLFKIKIYLIDRRF